MRTTYRQMLKYAATGVANTLLTLGVYALLRQCACSMDVANAAGYAAGMVCSFVLNKWWTFRNGHGHVLRQSLLFIAGCGLCWLLQWGAFRLMVGHLPEGIALLAGMAVYTAAGFAYNKIITFAPTSSR